MTNETGLVVGEQVLPTARSIKSILIDQLRSAYLTEKRKRGAVNVPEDTFDVQRGLGRVADTAGEYQRAFADVIKEAKELSAQELIEAVGEQDGVPRQGLTVPDPEGDLRIGLDTRNEYEIDPEILFPAVAAWALREFAPEVDDMFTVRPSESDDENADRREGALAVLLIEALRVLADLGTWKPKVTKVRDFAAYLSREGSDGVAATVTSGINKTTQYRGVKIERKDPK